MRHEPDSVPSGSLQPPWQCRASAALTLSGFWSGLRQPSAVGCWGSWMLCRWLPWSGAQSSWPSEIPVQVCGEQIIHTDVETKGTLQAWASLTTIGLYLAYQVVNIHMTICQLCRGVPYFTLCPSWEASERAATATGSIKLLISWTEAAICSWRVCNKDTYQIN